MRPRLARHGLGIPLTVVLILVACAAVSGLAFLYLSSQSVDHAIRSAGAAAAEAAAESEVEEVFHAIQQDANDLASPISGLLRDALLSGSPPSLDLSRYYEKPSALPAAWAASAESAFYGQIVLEPPRVTLDVVPAAEGGQPQILHLEASASARFAPASRRTVRHDHYVGITPVFPVKPFDQATFAIIEYDLLKVLPDLVKETRRLLDVYDSIPRMMVGWASIAESNTCGQPWCDGLACCGCKKLGCCGCPYAHCHRNEQDHSTTTWLFDQPQTSFHAKLYPCERYKFPIDWQLIPPRRLKEQLVVPEDSVVFSTDGHVELTDFNHEKKLAEEYYPRIQKLKEAAERFNGQVRSGIGRTFCKDDHSAWNGQMMATGHEMYEALAKAIDVLNEVLVHIHNHTTPGFTTETYQSVVASRSYLPTPLAFHLDSKAALDEVIAEHGSVSGHLATFSPGAMRVEYPAWRGKAILSASPEASGELIVGELGLDDPNRDRLVLWARELVLQGARVEASLFAAERAHFVSAAKISGNLILRHFIYRTQRGADEDLQGTVDRDPNVSAGPLEFGMDGVHALEPWHYAIGISPRLDVRSIQR